MPEGWTSVPEARASQGWGRTLKRAYEDTTPAG